ncbi:MAG: hypothetical protein ACUVWZ_11780 [Anaerolineae bacterium]
MMRAKWWLVLLAFILLISPVLGRWLYFFEGRYQPGPVPRPELAAIQAPTSELKMYRDHLTVSKPGLVLVDRAHENRFEMAELNVLQVRLTARGQRLEPVVTAEDLADQLREATALIIISPGKDWTFHEIQQVQDFVDKGGRLLLITDPTRFEIIYDEFGDYVGLDHDVTHINDLANRFGLVFQADYLYNTVENEGNFRNIRLTNLAEHELTEGVSQVVFYAAHSIRSVEPPLIAAGGETRSSSSEQAEAPGVAVLAADGQVLALGDLTFMTEPYHAVHDNDRLVAHLADWLSSAQRRYGLEDFPFFFSDQVDLVYAGDPVLDSELLAGSSTLQALFSTTGKELNIREAEQQTRDTLFLGLYESAHEVQPYLTAAQITLWMTPTEAVQAPPPASSLEVMMTPPVSLAIALPLSEGAGITTTAEVTAARNRLQIGSVGEMVWTGTSLFLLHTTDERQVLVVLADTEAGLQKAIDRLSEGDVKDCFLYPAGTPANPVIALCPTGEVISREEDGGWPKPEPQLPPSIPTPRPTAAPPPVTHTVEPPVPGEEPEGSILILAMDKDRGRYDNLTGAEEFAAILKERYLVRVWSLTSDGLPNRDDLDGYDLVIWTAGDFENPFGEAENNLLLTWALQNKSAIVSGAYVGDADVQAVERDIQVKDATHPMAKGFQRQEVIDFVSAPSGIEYETARFNEISEERGTVVFVRGPGSEETGAPSVFVLTGESGTLQIVFIGFPIYLLPEEARTRLVSETVDWLLAP